MGPRDLLFPAECRLNLSILHAVAVTNNEVVGDAAIPLFCVKTVEGFHRTSFRGRVVNDNSVPAFERFRFLIVPVVIVTGRELLGLETLFSKRYFFRKKVKKNKKSEQN